MAAKPAIPVETDPAKAASVLDVGGLVLLPTETVYGLAVSTGTPAAIARFRAARNALAGRETGAAASCWHAANVETVLEALAITQPVHRRLMRKLAPGPVTFAIELAPGVSAGVAGRLGIPQPVPFIDAHGALVRVPSHLLARALLGAARYFPAQWDPKLGIHVT